MNCKGKKPAIFLALLLALMFVLGAFFPSLSKESDKCEHDWSFFKTLTNVSCDTDGIMLVYCSRCSNFEQRVIPALGHSLVEGSAATLPTCTNSGTTASMICSTCNKIVKYPETILALGHNPVIVPGRAATCQETGLSDGKVCSRCSLVLVPQQILYGSHLDENSDSLCDFCDYEIITHIDDNFDGICDDCSESIFANANYSSVVAGEAISGWYRVSSIGYTSGDSDIPPTVHVGPFLFDFSKFVSSDGSTKKGTVTLSFTALCFSPDCDVNVVFEDSDDSIFSFYYATINSYGVFVYIPAEWALSFYSPIEMSGTLTGLVFSSRNTGQIEKVVY